MNSRVLNLVSFTIAAVIGAAALSALASRPLPSAGKTAVSLAKSAAIPTDGQRADERPGPNAPGVGR